MSPGKLMAGLGLFVAIFAGASAQTTVWNVPSGNWATSANWSNGVPASGYDVYFGEDGASTVDANYSVAQLTIDTGGDFNLGSSGAYTLTIGSQLNVTSGATDTIAVNLAGAASLNVTTAATLTLNGTNTMTGGTNVTGATLITGSTTALSPNSQLTLGANGILELGGLNNTVSSLISSSSSSQIDLGTATLTVGGSGGPYVNTTFAGLISGTGGLTYQIFDQTLTLTGENTYSGTTTANQGTIELGVGGAIGPGPIVLVSLGGITFANSGSNTYPNQISGNGTVTVLNNTVALSGINTYTGSTYVTNGTLDVANTSSLGSTNLVDLTGSALNLDDTNITIGYLTGDAASTVNLGTGDLTMSNIAANGIWSGIISGTGSVTILTGNLAFSGANTYSGGTILNGGQLNATNTTGSAFGSGPIAINGGGGSTLAIGDDDTTGIIPNVPIADNGILFFARTNSLTFPNTISGTGSVEVGDGGSITLSGNNSFTGLTTVDQATLLAGSTTALGDNTAFSINSNGGTLNLNGFNLQVGSIEAGQNGGILLGANTLTVGGVPGTTTFGAVISGTGGLTLTGPATEVTYLTGANTYTGPTVIQSGAILGLGFSSEAGSIAPNGGVSGAGTLEFYEPTATTYAGVLSGALNVSQTGAGTVTLSGTNTYTGTTTINAGTLQAGSAQAFGSLSQVTINGSGTLDLNNHNVTIGLLTSTSAASAVTLGTGTLSIDDNANATIASVISGSGGLSVFGGDTTILTGANTYTGTTVIDNGTVQVGDGATPGASIVGSVTDNAGLVFDPAPSDNLNFSGSVTGSGSIYFEGTGTITISGANFYSSGTFIHSGTVIAASNETFGTSGVFITGNSTLAVQAGNTVPNTLDFTGTGNVLGGDGRLSASLTTGSSVALEAFNVDNRGPGTLTFTNSLILGSGTTLDLNVYDATGAAGTGYGLIQVTQADGLQLTASAGTITLNLASVNSSGGGANAIDFNSSTSYSWEFATTAGTLSGFNANQFNIVSTGFTNGLGTGVFSVTEGGGDALFLDFTPVPEPSTWVLLGLGVTAVGLAVSRRRNRAISS